MISIEWEPELLHSAILSGSMPMIQYVESQIPNVHMNFVLDMSRIKRGQSSLLLDSMTYEKNQKKYFSHTINYAVQSKSISVLKYIHGLGYRITLSNIISGIQSGVLDILEYLLQNYDKKLPLYLIHYFNIDSYLIAVGITDLSLHLKCCNQLVSLNDTRSRIRFNPSLAEKKIIDFAEASMLKAKLGKA